jgi:exo-beta-1,3-glucanase (GH17 family)
VGTQAHIEAEVYDLQSGVQAVLAVVTYPNNKQESIDLQPTGNGARYRGAFTAEWTLNSVSQARVVVQATDGAGNRATREQTVQAVAQPPAPPF